MNYLLFMCIGMLLASKNKYTGKDIQYFVMPRNKLLKLICQNCLDAVKKSKNTYLCTFEETPVISSDGNEISAYESHPSQKTPMHSQIGKEKIMSEKANVSQDNNTPTLLPGFIRSGYWFINIYDISDLGWAYNSAISGDLSSSSQANFDFIGNYMMNDVNYIGFRDHCHTNNTFRNEFFNVCAEVNRIVETYITNYLAFYSDPNKTCKNFKVILASIFKCFNFYTLSGLKHDLDINLLTKAMDEEQKLIVARCEFSEMMKLINLMNK